MDDKDETSKHAPTPRRTGLDICATRNSCSHPLYRRKRSGLELSSNHALEPDVDILLPAAGTQDCHRVGIRERRRQDHREESESSAASSKAKGCIVIAD